MTKITASNLLMVGITGSGKSALCSILASLCGGDPSLFPSSDGSDAHTQEPIACICNTVNFGKITIMDGPGLMDTRGTSADEVNIRTIVDFTKSQKTLSAMIIVCNEANVRFDGAMQDIIKLLVDSFGISVLSITAIVFTHAAGIRTPEQARIKATEFSNMVSLRVGLAPGILNMPVYQVDCFPSELSKLGVSDSRIAEVSAKTNIALFDLIRWGANNNMIDMTNAIYGEYEAAKAVRESEIAAAEAERQRIIEQAKAEEAERQRIIEQAKAEEAERQRIIEQAKAEEAARIAAAKHAAQLLANQQAAAAETARIVAANHAAQLIASQNAAEAARITAANHTAQLLANQQAAAKAASDAAANHAAALQQALAQQPWHHNGSDGDSCSIM
jgi:hypothetical protein